MHKIAWIALGAVLASPLACLAQGGVPPSTQPAEKVTIVQDSPKAVLETMHKLSAAADLDGFVQIMDPALQPTMKIITERAKKATARNQQLAKLVAEKIDKDKAAKLNESGFNKVPSVLRDAVEDGKVNWDNVKITETGEAATVEINGKAAEVDLKKIDGKWYVAPPKSEGVTAEKLAELAEQSEKLMDGMMAMADEVEKKVKDGTITRDNFDEEYQAATMKVFMGMQKPAATAPAADGDF